MFSTQAPQRVLIISLRFLGDALISSMMAGGIKSRWPKCQVDCLVFDGMQGVLQGNGCVDRVLTLPAQATLGQRLGLMRHLWRQYDLALTAQAGDFPHQLLWAAGRQRIGALPNNPKHAWWKKRSAPRSVLEIPHEHIASLCARLMQQVGVVCDLQVSVPQGGEPVARLPAPGRYAVLNPCARWAYKRWHRAGWLALVLHLQGRGLQVVISGGDTQFEKQYLDALFEDVRGLVRLDGQLTFAQSAQVLASAALYVGPDTFTTHLASACNIPTVALFGPTDPRIWGPQRRLSRSAPLAYVAAAATQHIDNTWLLQNTQHACVPCQQEGCDQHQNSASQCLDTMSAAQVITAVDEILDSSG
ncbi:MAG: glycosyltransferase family 9 protein [Burkholderiaceae bacterium]